MRTGILARSPSRPDSAPRRLAGPRSRSSPLLRVLNGLGRSAFVAAPCEHLFPRYVEFARGDDGYPFAFSMR